MVKLAARNLLRQRSRTATTLAAIVFGVVGVILSGGFVEDLFVQLREVTIHSRLGHLQVYRDGHYLKGREAPFEYMIEEPQPVVAELARLPGVTDVLQRVSFSGLLSNGRSDLPVLGEGVEPEQEARLGSLLFVLEGRHLTSEDSGGVMLGEGLARALKLQVGDYGTLLANTRDGALNSLEVRVVGIFRTFSREYDARAVRVALPEAQGLLDVAAVHSIVVLLNDSLRTDAVAATLRDRVGPRGLEVWTWLDLDDFYPKTVALYKRQFGVLQVIILVIVFLSVLSSLSMTAYERTGEFGTIKALGHTTGHVYRLALVESVLLAVVGASLGVLLGVLLAWAISQVGIPMPPPPNSNAGYTAYIRIVATNLAIAFGIGLSATLLSSALATRGATRVPIVDALRQNV